MDISLTLAALSPKLTMFFHNYGALALFALVFLQDVGVPTGVPGTVLVLFGGYLVYTHALGLNEAAIVIALGAFLGASGMFFLARYGGRPLVLRLGRFVGLTAARLDSAAVAMDRVGPPMLLITRVAPGTRVYMTIFAGISGWTYRRFGTWTAIFCVLWAYTFVIMGDALGNRWESVGRFMTRSGIQLLVLALLVAVLYYGLRTLLNHGSTKDTAVARAVGQGLRIVRLHGLFMASAAPVTSATSIMAEPSLAVAAEPAPPTELTFAETNVAPDDLESTIGAEAPLP